MIMNKEKILLDVLNEHGDFKELRPHFNENDLACILEAMERYKGQSLPIDNVIKCDYCGDTGRVEPTLQYPDGIKCYKCP